MPDDGPPAKKARSAVPLIIKLEVEPEEEELIDFEFDGVQLECTSDMSVNEVSSMVEEKFVEMSEKSGSKVPLEITVIAFDTARHRAAGQIIMYGKKVGETFEPGEVLIVVAEVRPTGAMRDDDDDDEPVDDDEKIPCTVITGFLGAGKTTLLNHILTAQHGRRIAVLENEFGAMSIDDKLLSQKLTGAEQIVVADNGCICCTVRGDLVDMIGQVLDRNDTLPPEKQIEAILIETTGMSDPSPVLQTFVASERCQARCVVDGVITVVDTRNVLKHLEAEAEREGAEVNESVQQIAFADRIILNKMDLVTSKEAHDVVRAVRRINRASKVLRSVNSKVDVNEIIGIRSFDLSRIVSELDPDFVEAAKEEAESKKHEHKCSDECDHDHDDDGHHHHHHHHGHKEGEACTDECGHSHDDNAGAAAGKGKGKKHRHDQRVTSVGVVVEGEIDADDLDTWWRELMETKAKSIYRSKGILAMSGSPTKMVFQAVHELLRFEALDAWGPDEKRVNKMVFIGVDLDKKQLTDSFSKLVHNAS